MTSDLDATRSSYDTVAADYAEILSSELAGKPLDRAMLAAFAELVLADGGGPVAGVLAWYSTVHTPPEDLPAVFAEFHRVLAPSGHLLIAFKAGEQRFRLEHAYGHDVALDVYWFPPDQVAELLSQAGLAEVARLVREPAEFDRGPQCFLLARKR